MPDLSAYQERGIEALLKSLWYIVYMVLFYRRCYIECELTLKVTLGSQVADGQPQDGQPVEFAEDILLERQKGREGVQFCVEALAMSLAGITLGDAVF